MPRNPALSYAYKTAVFRIHNPSNRKQAMLRDALRRNHLAYTKLLTKLLPMLPVFEKEKVGLKRVNAVSRAAAPIVNPLPLSAGAKAGLISDAAGQISSHIELRKEQESTGRPSAARLTPTAESFAAAVDAVAAALTVEEENTARDRLIAEQRGGRCRPILFLANRVKDGYLLLMSREKTFYVYLNLHPKHSRFAKPVSVDGLIEVRTKKELKFTSKTGALFPVAFGRDFQAAEFIDKGRPQSAKLLERDGAFEVHITFEFETPKVAPTLFLGVDRGIYNLASLSVVDDAGRVVDQQNIDGRQLRFVQRKQERRQAHTQRRGKHYRSRARRHFADEAVHTAANAIVEIASKHAARVVIERLGQLTHTGKKRGRSSFNRLLTRSQYGKLQGLLVYKLAAVGLPKPVEVHPAFTSQTCPECGLADPENRPKIKAEDGFKTDRFLCRCCGHEGDADLNAARVIALKWMWRQSLPESQRQKRVKELPQQYSFATFLRDLPTRSRSDAR